MDQTSKRNRFGTWRTYLVILVIVVAQRWRLWVEITSQAARILKRVGNLNILELTRLDWDAPLSM